MAKSKLHTPSYQRSSPLLGSLSRRGSVGSTNDDTTRRTMMNPSNSSDVRRVVVPSSTSSRRKRRRKPTSTLSSICTSETFRASTMFATLCIFFLFQQVYLLKLLQDATYMGRYHQQQQPRADLQQQQQQHQTKALVQSPPSSLRSMAVADTISSTNMTKTTILSSTSSMITSSTPFSTTTTTTVSSSQNRPVPYYDPTSHVRGRGNNKNNNNNNTNTGSLLIYSIPPHYGQGTGNMVSGILAAVLLGEEFNRTVCIIEEQKGGSSSSSSSSSSFFDKKQQQQTSFHEAFQWRDIEHGRLCDWALMTINNQRPPYDKQQQQIQAPPTLQKNSSMSSEIPSSSSSSSSTTSEFPSSSSSLLPYIPPRNTSNTIQQNNYDRTSIQSECTMKDMLRSHHDYPVLYYMGNIYPRWPSPSNLFVIGGQQEASHSTIRPPETDNTTINDGGGSGTTSYRRNIFQEYFQPTDALLKILPWNVDDPPSVVVHLRQGDDHRDKRDGLDEDTLSVLATYNFSNGGPSSSSSSLSSPPSTVDSSSTSTTTTTIQHHPPLPTLKNSQIFLVTNQVGWYERFSHYPTNWSHPPWSLVRHSALRGIIWDGKEQQQRQQHQQQEQPTRRQENGDRSYQQQQLQLHQHSTSQNNGTTTTTTTSPLNDPSSSSSTLLNVAAFPPTSITNHKKNERVETVQEAILQMWSDWYTLLNAQMIYHTHSDFSLSAVRWNHNIVSWTIKGVVVDVDEVLDDHDNVVDVVGPAAAAVGVVNDTDSDATTTIETGNVKDGVVSSITTTSGGDGGSNDLHGKDHSQKKNHSTKKRYQLVLVQDVPDIIEPVRRLVDRTEEIDLRYCDPNRQGDEIKQFEENRLKQTIDMFLRRRQERRSSVM